MVVTHTFNTSTWEANLSEFGSQDSQDYYTEIEKEKKSGGAPWGPQFNLQLRVVV